MALSAVSPPKTKNAKVGAMQSAAAIFDILGSMGSLYDKFKPTKAPAPVKSVYDTPVDEFLEKPTEDFAEDVASTSDWYRREAQRWADARLSAKTKGMQSPLVSSGNPGVNRGVT